MRVRGWCYKRPDPETTKHNSDQRREGTASRLSVSEAKAFLAFSKRGCWNLNEWQWQMFTDENIIFENVLQIWFLPPNTSKCNIFLYVTFFALVFIYSIAVYSISVHYIYIIVIILLLSWSTFDKIKSLFYKIIRLLWFWMTASAGDYTPPPLTDPRLDCQLQSAPANKCQTDQLCFDFYHCPCSGALINSNWIQLVEDSVCTSADTHLVPTCFCLLRPAVKLCDNRSDHQQM